MSKSYNNFILLGESEDETAKKVRKYITDPNKIRRNDPGNPDICAVFALWKLIKPQHVPLVDRDCRSGALGCVQDKGDLAEALNDYLRPIRQRRAMYAADIAQVERIISEGTQRAREVAIETIADVKSAMRLL
jgi:tryptophanyl-tRNA synthetase